jgi:hypothetical protein
MEEALDTTTFPGRQTPKIEDHDHLEAWPVRLSLIRIVAISAFVLTLGCSVSKSHVPDS